MKNLKIILILILLFSSVYLKSFVNDKKWSYIGIVVSLAFTVKLLRIAKHHYNVYNELEDCLHLKKLDKQEHIEHRNEHLFYIGDPLFYSVPMVLLGIISYKLFNKS